jgi:hypothetical protein
MKLQITVTKEILEKSMWCGTGVLANTAKNCAIALAVRDIFPEATVFPLGGIKVNGSILENGIMLPQLARDFIGEFDNLSSTPEKRLLLNPLEFTVELPEQIVNSINIDDIYNSKTLELIK